jgi:hypothetical protein
MTDCAPGVASRNLLLFLIGALPCLLFAASAKADSAAGPAQGVAIVINEDPANPQGQRHQGSVVWRIIRTKAAGQPDEPVIHADVEIPDMKMTMTMDFKHNTDKSLPASHVVEMTFALPQDVAGGEVLNAPGIMMKFTEQARGLPFAALSVKVSKGSFLVGLSDQQGDRERNLQLLQERAWFDIPMVYANQHRGILAIEKGFGGESIFHEAMVEWARPPAR